MSDLNQGRRGPPPLVFGASLGLAGAGVVALLVGGMYYYSALQFELFTPRDLHGLLVFVPTLVTFTCCAGLLGRRRRVAVVVLALFSAVGLAIQLLQTSGWGMGACDGDPERIKRFDRFTYVSDVLFCFAYAIQLAASAVLILTRGGLSDDVREKRIEETPSMDSK